MTARNLTHSFNNKFLPIIASLLALTTVLLISCRWDESDDFVPENTLKSKLFVFGSQIDNAGNLVLYINGTDTLGNPLTVSDLANASVTVGDEVETKTYTNDGINLTVQPVKDGDKILSLAFITDYSGSMTDQDLNNIGDVYGLILANLPLVYELEVINFSDLPHLRLDWTEAYPNNMATILTALVRDDSFRRNGTALYDSVGLALERDLNIVGSPTTQGDGLQERCRPAHMMVVFSDGLENWSTTYTNRDTLLSMMDQSETVAIMLGTENANQQELEFFAGERGAVVSVFNTGGIATEIASWAKSLQHITTLRLSPNTAFANKTVNVLLGEQSVTLIRPTDALCELTN